MRRAEDAADLQRRRGGQDVTAVASKLQSLRGDVQTLSTLVTDKILQSVIATAVECEEVGLALQVDQLHASMERYNVAIDRLAHNDSTLRVLAEQLLANGALASEKSVLDELKNCENSFIYSGKNHHLCTDFLEAVYVLFTIGLFTYSVKVDELTDLFVQAVRNNPKYMPGASQTGGDNDDLEIVGLTQDFTCPLTAQIMKEPVRSKICRHHYEKYAIEEFIRQHLSRREKAECPVAGCSYFLTLADLERNQALERQLRRLRDSQGTDEQTHRGDYVMVE